ncbi:hypothetical protein M0804_013129 [Polistes exclamans]|nr:hypothetical protein M0804_013129 [Polistes exclamans]
MSLEQRQSRQLAHHRDIQSQHSFVTHEVKDVSNNIHGGVYSSRELRFIGDDDDDDDDNDDDDDDDDGTPCVGTRPVY